MVSGAGFLRGKPVYSGGSFAPNRGQVSAQGAQGYLKRELKNRAVLNNGGPSRFAPHTGVSRFGPDGQSDTRSGAAASMLRQGLGGGKDTGGPKVPHTPQEPDRTKQDPLNPGPNGQPGPPKPPTVTINENGQLELPYSDEWSESLLTGMRDMNQQLLDLQMAGQQQSLEFMNANRDLDLGYGNQKVETLNENAAGGTAFSSQYSTGVARDATQYNNLKNDLASQSALDKMGIDTERTAIQNAFNDMLRTEILNRAREAAENAGGLGYGKDKPKVGPNQNTAVRADGKRRRRRRRRNNSGGSGGK